jgi:hypothetical protein
MGESGYIDCFFNELNAIVPFSLPETLDRIKPPLKTVVGVAFLRFSKMSNNQASIYRLFGKRQNEKSGNRIAAAENEM